MASKDEDRKGKRRRERGDPLADTQEGGIEAISDAIRSDRELDEPSPSSSASGDLLGGADARDEQRDDRPESAVARLEPLDREARHRGGGLDSDGPGASRADGHSRRTISVSETWEGPIPHPGALRGYEEVLPGSADRILSMAESSIAARDTALTRATDAEISYARDGQRFAFFLAGVTVIAAIVFFAFDKVIPGSILLGLPVILLIRSFLKPDDADSPTDEE